jgi:hypothetical protein
MKTCDYCGRQNEASADACFECGKCEFGSPPPNLPISRQEKDWIEKSFVWLLDEFGADYFLSRRTILPEQSFFPDRYKATEECARQVVERVCGYMDVDPAAIEVDIFLEGEDLAAKYHTGDSDSKPGASGLYYHPTDSNPRPVIAINESNLKNPVKLVATITHELGHVIPLGGGRISREDMHHEDLTDLITVFFGMGIFTANAAFQFTQWQTHSHQGWKASRLGYISEEMFAYGLACYTRLRNEPKPDWAKYLSMNVGAHFKRCQKYFQKGGEANLPILKT